jgi:hypothetical protein
LIVYAHDGCEGWFYAFVVFLSFLYRGVPFSVWWDGQDCVGVKVLVEWELLWSPIFMVDH